jgi:hypothetical protein
MMKQFYNILCGLLVLILLVTGMISFFDKDTAFSQIENRDLKTFPSITFSGLMDGSFFADLTAYYADTFPGREGMMNKNLLDAFYCFGGDPSSVENDKPAE